MSGGYLEKFKKNFGVILFFGIFLSSLVIAFAAYSLFFYTKLGSNLILISLVAVAILVSLVSSLLLKGILAKPLEYLAQTIFHISPNEHFVAAPDANKLSLGKELAISLTRQIYDLTTNGNSIVQSNINQNVSLQSVLDNLTTPILGLDKSKNLVYANKNAIDKFNLLNWQNTPVMAHLNMKFDKKDLDDWLNESSGQSINSSYSFKKVSLGGINSESKSYFDIIASHNQSSASGIETLLTLFEHSEIYEAEENTLNFIAMTVHEIRTPLTIMRGYVEVIKQELDGKVDDKTQVYIDRLKASSEGLSTFMANILSVAKADQNQLNLNLTEGNWETSLTSIVKNLQNRATVRGKIIHLNIAPNLPTVASDMVSLNEVVANLVDNAIKYSPPDKTNIWIESSVDTDDSVLTTVRDEGIGIAQTVIPNLFSRFYRNHRSRNQVSGTGLGLYISKEIVSAHHGNIWVKSIENQGTTIGFTLVPYAKLADSLQTSDNGFVPVAHGWIKNHNMQRR